MANGDERDGVVHEVHAHLVLKVKIHRLTQVVQALHDFAEQRRFEGERLVFVLI